GRRPLSKDTPTTSTASPTARTTRPCSPEAATGRSASGMPTRGSNARRSRWNTLNPDDELSFSRDACGARGWRAPQASRLNVLVGQVRPLPDLDRPVKAGGDQGGPAGGEGHPRDAAGVAAQRRQLLPRPRPPDPHRPVVAAARQQLPARAEGQGAYRRG